MKRDGSPLLLVQRCWAAGLAEQSAGSQLSCSLWEALCPGRADGLLSCLVEPRCSPCCSPMVGDAPVGLLLQVGCRLTFMRGHLFSVCDELLFCWGETGIFEWKMGFQCAKSRGFS